MLRSNRGAARVSVMWIIVAGVLFLAGVGFAFVASSDLAKAQEDAQAARTAAATFSPTHQNPAATPCSRSRWYSAIPVVAITSLNWPHMP